MGLFDFLTGSKKETEEEKRDREQQLKNTIEAHKKKLTLENIAIAFSCPFRSDFSNGSELRLFEFGKIENKDLERFKKVIFRDFDIEDFESLKNTLSDWEESLAEENDLATTVFINSVYLYIITSAIELGYASTYDLEKQIKSSLKVIALNEDVTSWKRFGELFVEGDYINSRDYQKRVFGDHCEELANSELSPWGAFEWKKVEEFILQL